MTVDDQRRISVCMATHDGAAHVEQQLVSILREIGPQDEVVVVDDASRDDTVARVEAVSDPRVRLVRLDRNVGYVRAFEQALTLATGDQLLLSDQDDVWPQGRVTAMTHALERACVVAGNVAVLGGEERLRGPFGERDWRLRVATERHRWRNVARLGASDLPYYGSAMGLRRDALALVLPFPHSVHELHDAWIALVGIFLGSMAHVEERVVLRRVHASNTSGRVRSPWLVVRGRWWYLQMVRDARRRSLTVPATRPLRRIGLGRGRRASR